MKSRYQAIYLSPHLDDVVLSCGGQIAARCRRGEAVLIATLAAGDSTHVLSPLARELHTNWGIDDSFRARREEDVAACRRLGADFWHGDGSDAIYRHDAATGEPVYQILNEVFGRVKTGDTALELWTEQIRSLPPADAVFAPLGAGGHVDHQLVRLAAEAVAGRRLGYYEDFPYASKFLAVRRMTTPRRAWRPEVVALDEQDIRARCDASGLFYSQVGMLAGGREGLEKKIRAYIRRVGGERIWRRV